MKTNNKIFLKIRLLFCLFALSTTLWSCNDTPDYNDAYDNTTATTAVAQKLVAGTGLIGHMIDDRTWTVTDGVEATEIAYVSYEGYTTKMFVVEVDLSNPAISIAASLPDNGTTFKMQSMTRQALAADAAGNKVWAGFNADFFNMTTGVPRGPVHRNGVMLKNTFDSGERSVFYITRDKKAAVAHRDDYPAVNASGVIQEAVGGGVSYMIVSEAGASVYSASKLAAEEFPDYDVNLRSAVSIARRLQDPLAELVKIDPKAIGVGQYQHDMPQKELDASLNAVVEDCVNAVGVDLNTASPSLLTRVAGLNGTIAKNIVAFREENGVFTTRRQLLKVAKLGPKAFEQCAGFLRVPESKNVLDNTGVHPESYDAAKGLLELLGATPKDARDLPARLNAYGAEKAAEALGVGVPTLRDIAKELSKPGRDPRDELPAPILRTDVLDIKDLKPGMVLTGTVRNVIDFGVFVDIGVHQDGLVHISQVCNKFIKHPSEAVAVGDVVKVVVLDVDEKKHRISLSMKQVPEE